MHPSRGLDVHATQEVQSALLEARNGGCAILLISDDLDEVLLDERPDRRDVRRPRRRTCSTAGTPTGSGSGCSWAATTGARPMSEGSADGGHVESTDAGLVLAVIPSRAPPQRDARAGCGGPRRGRGRRPPDSRRDPRPDRPQPVRAARKGARRHVRRASGHGRDAAAPHADPDDRPGGAHRPAHEDLEHRLRGPVLHGRLGGRWDRHPLGRTSWPGTDRDGPGRCCRRRGVDPGPRRGPRPVAGQ